MNKPQCEKTGRALGRGFFALGTAMTFKSEYQKADAALKEQQPGLSDGERFLKAGEKPPSAQDHK